jgi:ferredoxin-type protein NapH
MSKHTGRRQRVRKGLIVGTMLLFPVVLYYFSPDLPIESAAEGLLNGSLIMFGLMFVSALLVGRAWCGWVCPAGGLQEVWTAANNGPFKTGKRDSIKWFIWTPWLAGIAVAVISAGGYHGVDFFYRTDHGISVADSHALIIYYLVVALFSALALLAGRRAGCHTICWMAPFMILGRKLRNAGRWPALRLTAQPDMCHDCQTCTTHCPMSLNVNALVHRDSMEHSECILCGTCVDGCPKGAIRFTFSAGK